MARWRENRGENLGALAPVVLDCPASLPAWRQSAPVVGTGRGSGSGRVQPDSPRAVSLLGADSAESVPAKGIRLTPVTRAVPSRSQRRALGPWAATATTTWTLWAPSFCRAPRANCTFKVGCRWKWWAQIGGGGGRLREEGWGVSGGQMWREKEEEDERQRETNES